MTTTSAGTVVGTFLESKMTSPGIFGTVATSFDGTVDGNHESGTTTGECHDGGTTTVTVTVGTVTVH